MPNAEENTKDKEISTGNGDIVVATSANEQVKAARVFEFTFDGDKTQDLSLKEAVVANIIVGIIALAIYFPVEMQHYQIMYSQYYFHVLLSLICFVLVPIIYMIIISFNVVRNVPPNFSALFEIQSIFTTPQWSITNKITNIYKLTYFY